MFSRARCLLQPFDSGGAGLARSSRVSVEATFRQASAERRSVAWRTSSRRGWLNGYIYMGNGIARFFFTIDYEGVLVTSIEVLRRELARELLPITFQS